jgi:hypothetical protein
MTQPVAPGARAACFDEPSADPIECTSPPLAPSLPLTPPPSWCAEGLQAFEAIAARSPPSFESRTPTEPAGLRFCREADTVAEGFLCSEPVVVSSACRRPNNAFDAYVCDEPRMHALQTKVWRATRWVVRTLVAQILNGNKAR